MRMKRSAAVSSHKPLGRLSTLAQTDGNAGALAHHTHTTYIRPRLLYVTPPRIQPPAMLPPRTIVKNRKNAAHTFNMLVAGHARSGKSSFISTLFETLKAVRLQYPSAGTPPSMYGSAESLDRASARSMPASNSLLDLQLQALQLADPDSPLPPRNASTVMPAPAGIECTIPGSRERMMLNLIDSPGLEVPPSLFKASAANEPVAERVAGTYLNTILAYVEGQYEATLAEENRVRRNPRAPDFQTHVCIYMLNPDVVIASNGLSVVDRYVLKRLCHRVNVVPCLAKSDLFTVRQLTKIRALIANDLLAHDIPVYAFPDDVSEDEDEEPEQNHKEDGQNLRAMVPFRLVNSEETTDEGAAPFTGVVVNNTKILGREYTWGVVEVENAAHCDFVDLTSALFNEYMDDLKSHTREVLYETWRTDRLSDTRAITAGRDSAASLKKNPSIYTAREE
ncbi:Septin-domain-containing protein [Entophlyctis helioformis]|nr:Septin-domain-containing protein [Entophlyctis helioformis]